MVCPVPETFLKDVISTDEVERRPDCEYLEASQTGGLARLRSFVRRRRFVRRLTWHSQRSTLPSVLQHPFLLRPPQASSG
jgi:hypothetical protein